MDVALQLRLTSREWIVMEYGRKVVVVGMARSGVAAVKLLLPKGANVRAVDEKPMGEVQGITVEPQTEAAFRDADLVVLSPGVPADLDVLTTVRARGVPVIGELELAAPFLQGGISASPERTAKPPLPRSPVTFCASPESPARWAATSEPRPAAMVETSRPDQWNVLELSSFQLETIQTFHAPIAACLNVTQNHLDRHHTFENYENAKARLFETQRENDWAVLNADDPVTIDIRPAHSRHHRLVQQFSSGFRRVAGRRCNSPGRRAS